MKALREVETTNSALSGAFSVFRVFFSSEISEKMTLILLIAA